MEKLLKQFRKEEPELFDKETGEFYTGVAISPRQCELMRDVINTLDKRLNYPKFFTKNLQKEIDNTCEVIEMKMIASIDMPNMKCEDIYKTEIKKLILKIFNKNEWIKLQHHFNSTKGLNCTDFLLNKISTQVVNSINKEFNLELKTIDLAEMDGFILKYLESVFFTL